MHPLWKTIWKFLNKLKIELACNPAVALLGICLKDTKILIQRGTCTLVFIAAIPTIARLWKEPKFPTTDDKDVVCVCVCTCTCEWNLAIYTDVDGAREYYAKQNKSVRERHDIWFHSCGVLKMCIYFERKKACTEVGEGQRERESQAGSSLSAQSPVWGLISQTMRSWPELISRARHLTNWATQAFHCVIFKTQKKQAKGKKRER